MNYQEFDAIDPTSKSFRALAYLLASARLSGFVMSLYAIMQGVLIIIGGSKRFSASAYHTAMLLPGAPASWGWVLLLCGATAFFGLKNRSYKLGFWGMFGAGVWSFAFGGAFLVSSIQYPEANLTAMVTYGKDAVLFLIMAMVHRVLSHIPTRPEETDA